MSKKQCFVCDRCGVEINAHNNQNPELIILCALIKPGIYPQRFDLCPKCYEGFIEWMGSRDKYGGA